MMGAIAEDVRQHGRESRYFLNLTNGIEAAGIVPAGWSVVRIQSTDIEHGSWPTLLLGLDHNLLFWLSQGVRCVIVDYGCRREIGKVISEGVPFIREFLEMVWLSDGPSRTWDCSHAQRALLARKYGYYRRWLNTDEIRLVGLSERTEMDSKREFYRQRLSDYWKEQANV